MNWLKNLLSEKTYQLLTEKLGTDLVKSISEKTQDFTIDTAEEKFIPKGKFDEERNRVKDLTEQLKARDGQLNELQKSAKGNEELTKQLEALKEANAKQLAEREKRITLLKRRTTYVVGKAIL